MLFSHQGGNRDPILIAAGVMASSSEMSTKMPELTKTNSDKICWVHTPGVKEKLQQKD